jgi:CubicO group peptidase (beta-lactamase class C family)
MIRTGTAYLVVFMVSSILLAGPTIAQETGLSFQERLSGLAEVSKVPGYTAVKMARGADTQRYYGGVLKAGESKPVSLNSIQVHGSLSPLLVSMATMKAVEQGHFSLDTKINELIPFEVFHPAGRTMSITVRQLLAHTSGIQDETGSFFKNYLFTDDLNYNNEALNSEEKRMLRRANLNSRFSLQTLLQKSLTLKGEFYSKNTFSNNIPGDAVEFSMTGLSLLALVIESSTGYFFDQYTTEFIFEPLGMKSATWTIPPSSLESTSPHMSSNMDVIPDHNAILYPSAGFRASTADVEKLIAEVVEGLGGEGKVLNADSWQSIFSRLVPNFQNSTVPTMNPAPITVLSSYNMAGYHVLGAQNYGSTSVLLIEPQKGEAIYFTSNTSFAHLNRGGFFLSEIMRLLVEPYEQ